MPYGSRYDDSAEPPLIDQSGRSRELRPLGAPDDQCPVDDDAELDEDDTNG